MTSRMQITMEPELRLRANRKAERQGISFAEYVRRTLEKDLAENGIKPDVGMIIGLGASAEKTNVAKEKNTLLAESLGVKTKR